MEITYVYQNTESGLYTVGYYNATGKWIPESDHESSELAAARVHYLNGGCGHCADVPALVKALKSFPITHWGGVDHLQTCPRSIGETYPCNTNCSLWRDALLKAKGVGRG